MDLLVAMEECDEVLRGNYGDGDPRQSLMDETLGCKLRNGR